MKGGAAQAIELRDHQHVDLTAGCKLEHFRKLRPVIAASGHSRLHKRWSGKHPIILRANVRLYLAALLLKREPLLRLLRRADPDVGGGSGGGGHRPASLARPQW